MYKNYLVTGATGFLGRAVITELIRRGQTVKALVMKNDKSEKELPQSVIVSYGDVCDNNSLKDFFSDANSQTCVIHCAGIVSVATRPDDKIYKVNVGGTKNVLQNCERLKVGKLVYVSSVHAIPETPKGTVITENTALSADKVYGDYSKSKALATSLVFKAANRGLNVNVVYPSGIIGPGDLGNGGITSMIRSFLSEKMRFAVKGGYDFVDVRDVASGIVSCAERGRSGTGYILSGHYASIRELLDAARIAGGVKRKVFFFPICFARLLAPLYEKRSLRKKLPIYFTPYSVKVLTANGQFSYKAAADTFGYSPRSLQSSICDTVFWLRESAPESSPNSPTKNFRLFSLFCS